MRILPALGLAAATGAMCLAPRPAIAQHIAPGTIAISGVSALSTNRQTITNTLSSGGLQLTNLNVGWVHFGLEGTYFIGRRVGIGFLASNQRLTETVPDRDAVARVASTYFGPLLHARIHLGGRSTFAVIGSFGGTTTTIENHNTGIGDEANIHANGRYWLAGGGLSLELAPRLTFDLGVRYQSTTFTGAPGTTGRTTSAGMLVHVAISVYLH